MKECIVVKCKCPAHLCGCKPGLLSPWVGSTLRYPDFLTSAPVCELCRKLSSCIHTCTMLSLTHSAHSAHRSFALHASVSSLNPLHFYHSSSLVQLVSGSLDANNFTANVCGLTQMQPSFFQGSTNDNTLHYQAFLFIHMQFDWNLAHMLISA